jgi:hypothetical protein
VDQGHLWTALRWAAAALHQTERVYASLERYLEANRSRRGKGVIRLTPEMQRPRAVFWSDLHFLMIAVKHLDFALQRLGRGAPRLDKDVSKNAVELRQLLEHWWEAGPSAKRWKKYRDKHGELAHPAQLQYGPGNPVRLTIGADPLSINELEADIRRVEKELTEIEART